MVLNTHPIYPSAGRYVLRLHCDTRPQGGGLVGHIEHVTSGDSCVFANSEQLMAWLERRASNNPCPKEKE